MCPDFVVELRPLWYLRSSTPSDNLTELQAKMKKYLENGVRLGWLIDRPQRSVYIYRPGAAVETLESPEILSGESLLPEFTLDLSKTW
ncbi:MAG: Uma2 family endonuclease [Leptolyngbyaceae cyanobacterium RM1_406_9]|nr:Uma2 family endonuclease [Leptolyngbyaceae cyanobacterium RM1_406_9]